MNASLHFQKWPQKWVFAAARNQSGQMAAHTESGSKVSSCLALSFEIFLSKVISAARCWSFLDNFFRSQPFYVKCLEVIYVWFSTIQMKLSWIEYIVMLHFVTDLQFSQIVASARMSLSLETVSEERVSLMDGKYISKEQSIKTFNVWEDNLGIVFSYNLSPYFFKTNSWRMEAMEVSYQKWQAGAWLN